MDAVLMLWMMGLQKGVDLRGLEAREVGAAGSDCYYGFWRIGRSGRRNWGLSDWLCGHDGSLG